MTSRCNIVFRLVPGTRANARCVASIAGASRWVWNRVLSDCKAEYKAWEEAGKSGAKPSLSAFSLMKRMPALRDENEWLKALPCAEIRHVLKRQADAWKRKFSGDSGSPKFKARRGEDSFMIPQNVRIQEDSASGATRIYISKAGWMVLRRRGGNPYKGCRPAQAVIKRVLGKWHCVVCFEVDVEPPVHNGRAVGVDCNVRQIADSDGAIDRMPDAARLEARRKRYQRMMSRRKKGSKRRSLAQHRCAKVSRRLAMIRADWQHQASRLLAEKAGTIIVEDLKIRNMTQSAKGTAEAPGKKVRQKAGLNREILATGWGALHAKLAYKCADFVKVDPKYTSQTCRKCGHVDAANRKSQAKFRCVQCGHTGNADVNAALNILARGTGAAARGGAFALATPAIRERGCLAQP